MDKYLEAEKELAGLLGWEGLHIAVPWYGKVEEVCLTTPLGKVVEADVPRWTRDNAAAFQLMVEHDCYPGESVGLITIDNRNWNPSDRASKPHLACIYVTDHNNDKQAAVRYAIVQAVIAKLRSQDAKP